MMKREPHDIQKFLEDCYSFCSYMFMALISFVLIKKIAFIIFNCSIFHYRCWFWVAFLDPYFMRCAEISETVCTFPHQLSF